MKINLWYSKSMQQWRWTLSEEFKNGVTKMEQHSGQRIYLRDAMEDVAKTVEYMLECKDKGDCSVVEHLVYTEGVTGSNPVSPILNLILDAK